MTSGAVTSTFATGTSLYLVRKKLSSLSAHEMKCSSVEGNVTVRGRCLDVEALSDSSITSEVDEAGDVDMREGDGTSEHQSSRLKYQRPSQMNGSGMTSECYITPAHRRPRAPAIPFTQSATIVRLQLVYPVTTTTITAASHTVTIQQQASPSTAMQRLVVTFHSLNPFE
jgi:hypothetical protein